jgi:uncharacterized membrane protein YgdD (TMEM256/DUF423 family)
MIGGRVWLAIGAVYGGTAVGLGAYAHHGLSGEAYLVDGFKTGVTYQMWHALALMGVGLLVQQDAFRGSRLAAAAGVLFTLGVILFSGSLYWFGLTAGVPVHGAAPLGGVMMMAGWAGLLAAALTRR